MGVVFSTMKRLTAAEAGVVANSPARTSSLVFMIPPRDFLPA
jgi:hypothetical protein